jgi:peptidoglycan/xylan/chitin deacetylase (PgdA/CDA1 family)
MAVILVFGILGTLLFLAVIIETNIDRALEPEVRDNNYGSNPQFVLLAFDGSASIPMWQETRDFAKELAAKNKIVHFTYFISGIYFLTEKNKDQYQPPVFSKGSSLIGYADSYEDIDARVQQINASLAEGHEIASHAVGHFNGIRWSVPQWEQELNDFDQVLFHIETNNPEIILTRPLAIASSTEIVGFRAPELGANDNLEQTLAKRHYRYDASKVSLNGNWPTKNKYGLWEFSLATIQLPPHNLTTISMDYNIFISQTGAQNTLKKDSLSWATNRDYLLQAYKNYFYKHYRGNRAPIFIGHHFSKWNDGVYWEAMKDFAREVCGLPNVRCITHRALADYLDQRK